MNPYEIKDLVTQIPTLSDSALHTHIEQLEAAFDNAGFMEDSLLAMVAAGLMHTELLNRQATRTGETRPPGQKSEINIPEPLIKGMKPVTELLGIEMDDALGLLLLAQTLHLQAIDKLDETMGEVHRKMTEDEGGDTSE